jgi:hypothetical protein
MAEPLSEWQGAVVDRMGTGDERSEVPAAVTQQLKRLRQVEEQLADLTKSVSGNDLSASVEVSGPEAERADEPEPESEPAPGASAPRSRRWRGPRRKSEA